MSWRQLWQDLQANFDIVRPDGFDKLSNYEKHRYIQVALNRCRRREKNLLQHRLANALEQWRAVNPNEVEQPDVVALEAFDPGITLAAERVARIANKVRDAIDKIDQELEVVVSITPREE